MIRIINLVDRRWVRFTSLSHRMKMYFLDPSSSIIFKLSLIKVSEIHLSLPHRINLSFVDQPSRMIWTIPSTKVNEIHFSLSEWISHFCMSIVDNVLDNSVDQKWVKSCVSPRMNLCLLQVNRRQCFGQCRRSKSEWNSLLSSRLNICIF